MQRTLLLRIKQEIKKYRLGILVSDVKNAVMNAYFNRNGLEKRFISLKSEKPFRGNVLVSYINVPFFLKGGQAVSNTHTNYWESLQIARTFLDLGYSVDVISWANSEFIPTKDYSFFIDIRMNLERMTPLLNKDCIKIMHIDTAHWLFHMTAQHRRLLALQERRGVTLSLHKTVSPNLGIEYADCATILGNEFTVSTYRYANKPMYRVPISTPVRYSRPDGKDFDACRKNFLWFGSFGLVHKGLDLVLEAFADMPDYHLTVCGPINKEADFERAYYKELYETPNIHTVGWTDINSPKFTEITNSCVGMIYPSCSEGQSGGVVSCLHAGLIPIISYESGVDVDPNFGAILKTCSVEEIKRTIGGVSLLPSERLKQMACQAWEFARANHTREKFAEEYRKTILNIMATFGRKEPSLSPAHGYMLGQVDQSHRGAYIP